MKWDDLRGAAEDRRTTRMNAAIVMANALARDILRAGAQPDALAALSAIAKDIAEECEVPFAYAAGLVAGIADVGGPVVVPHKEYLP